MKFAGSKVTKITTKKDQIPPPKPKRTTKVIKFNKHHVEIEQRLNRIFGQ